MRVSTELGIMGDEHGRPRRMTSSALAGFKPGMRPRECVTHHHPNRRSTPLYVKLQLVMYADDGREETVADIVTLKKDSKWIKHLGLTLA
jgi:hypothetical protein